MPPATRCLIATHLLSFTSKSHIDPGGKVIQPQDLWQKHAVLKTMNLTMCNTRAHVHVMWDWTEVTRTVSLNMWKWTFWWVIIHAQRHSHCKILNHLSRSLLLWSCLTFSPVSYLSSMKQLHEIKALPSYLAGCDHNWMLVLCQEVQSPIAMSELNLYYLVVCYPHENTAASLWTVLTKPIYD